MEKDGLLFITDTIEHLSCPILYIICSPRHHRCRAQAQSRSLRGPGRLLSPPVNSPFFFSIFTSSQCRPDLSSLDAPKLPNLPGVECISTQS